MLSETFWDGVPPFDISEYVNNIDAESPVGESITARDCEVQALCMLYLALTETEAEKMEEALQSRVNMRRNCFAEWTDDDGPFSEEEVRNLRSQVKPWAFPPEIKAQLAQISA